MACFRHTRGSSEITFKKSGPPEAADKGLTAILDYAKVGVTVQELYAIGVYTVLKEGGTYCRPRIISGPDSGSMSLRWPPATERRLEPGDVVVVDFWGYYKNYLFDINRTIGIGPLNKDKRDLLEAGLEATLDLIKHIKPGLTSADLYNISYDFVSRQEKERNPILKVGYIGQIGHGIGLESERPRITEGEQSVIKEGMILSIEPGFYIPDFGGVRIEDEVLVTKDGCENITKCRHVAW